MLWCIAPTLFVIYTIHLTTLSVASWQLPKQASHHCDVDNLEHSFFQRLVMLNDVARPGCCHQCWCQNVQGLATAAAVAQQLLIRLDAVVNVLMQPTGWPTAEA